MIIDLRSCLSSMISSNSGRSFADKVKRGKTFHLVTVKSTANGNAETDIKTVSSLLGHASIKMTEKYLHVIDSRKQKAINRLGKNAFDTEVT